MYILDEVSSEKIITFFDKKENIPYIDDLFRLDYRVDESLLTNLFKECVESLIKENTSSKTTLTLHSYDELIDSGFFDHEAPYGNDMPQHLRILLHETLVNGQIEVNSSSQIVDIQTSYGHSTTT